MIELPDLDDRTFAELLAQARARIPGLSPQWTDHNPSDPGIVLVELLAWLTEIVLYRVDRVPDRSERAFLRLLRGPQSPPADGSSLPLDDAIRETLAELRERHRAITAEDFERLALHRWALQPGVAALGVPGIVRRARCLAEQSPATLRTPGRAAEGQYTLVVVPDALAAGRQDLPSFATARSHVLQLDGTQGYVDCGSHASLAVTGALTLSAWIFPRAVDRRQALVARKAAGEYEFTIEPGGTLAFRHADGVDGGVSQGQVTAGRWNHVAVVRAADGKSLRFFIDGRPAGTSPLARPAVASTAPVLLGRASAGGDHFGGFLRDVCVWNIARSEVDIGGDLRRVPPGADDAPGSAPRPVACWRLDRARDQVEPDAETPAAATVRPRDGRLMPAGQGAAAGWRNAIRPLPAAPALLQGLRDWLDEWRLLTTKVHVVDHRAVPVQVKAKIYLASDGLRDAVQASAAAALEAFLHALGGWRGDGWPFGRAIFESDIAAVLDKLPGIDFVEGIQVSLLTPEAGRPADPKSDQGARMGLALHPDELPALDAVSFEFFHRVGAKWQPT